MSERSKAQKHSKSKSGSYSGSPAPASLAPVTRKPRSGSHISFPISFTPSPILLVRIHAKEAGELPEAHDFGTMDVVSPSIVVIAASASSSKRVIRLPLQLRKLASMTMIDVAVLKVRDLKPENAPRVWRMLSKNPERWVKECSKRHVYQQLSHPQTAYPANLTSLIHSSAFLSPFHIFTVYSRAPKGRDIVPTKHKKATLHRSSHYPAYGIVLAAYCANLPT